MIRAAIEAVERRTLLSDGVFGADHLFVPPQDISHSPKENVDSAFTNYKVYNPSSDPTAQPFGVALPPVGAQTPSMVLKSYGVDKVKFGNVVGDGSGQTIAIIDAYDNPSFVSSSNPTFNISDLHRFDVAFDLPDPPVFKKFSQSGGTSYPSSGVSNGWAGEIALDVEWAHAMAPKANIYLVEANSATFGNLDTAVDWARNQPEVSVVTMSYGAGDFAGESELDELFTTPGGHEGVTFFSSSGDDGGLVQYQSSSPNVVGVGGTSLFQSNIDGTYDHEEAWSGSGGGIALNELKPYYQGFISTQSKLQRTAPDVSALADPFTGVAVMDSSSNGGIGSPTPWVNGYFGGTSLSSPMWAGFMAIVNQGRSLLSTPQGPLDGSSQTLPRLYSLSASNFHDVTVGEAGNFKAAAGYDLITGRGSPRLDLLAPALAGGASISGTVFQDNNGNGAFDSGEPTHAGVTVYLDLNNNKADDSFEPTTATDNSGNYLFTDVVAGASIHVREILPLNFAPTISSSTANTSYDTLSSNVNLGDFPKTFAATSGNANFTLALDSTRTFVKINDGVNTYTINKGLLPNLSLVAGDGDDTLTIDATNGSPMPSNTMFFDGGTGANTVKIVGSPGTAEAVTYDGNTITYGRTVFTVNGNASFSFDGGGGGGDSLVINSGTVTVLNNQLLTDLKVEEGATLKMPANGGHFIDASNFGINGTVDIADNAMIVDDPLGPDINDVSASIEQARAVDVGGNPTWSGEGITSSLAAASPSKFGVGAIFNGAVLEPYHTFFGQPVGTNASLIRYTALGDANLDGKSDTQDFAQLALNFNTSSFASWNQGDFNFDGMVNALDFNALASGFGTTLGPASPPVAGASVAPSLFSSSLVDASGVALQDLLV